jgi:molybdopterin converting factor subunit 1
MRVTVTVQLFARLREIAGQSEIEVEVPGGATVDDVWRALAGRHTALAPFGASVSCAVNEDFARRGARVQDGDKVAFLPPVSGGSS